MFAPKRHTVHTGPFKHLLPADFVCAGSVLLRGCVWLCERGCSLALVSGLLQHWPLWWCAGSRKCRPLSLRLMDSVAPWRVGSSGSWIEPVSLALAGRFFTTRETPYRGSLQNDIFLSSFTSVALTVTSNARVSLHTDSVSGETTAGVLGQGGGACRVQRGLREEFRIQLFQTGPHLTHLFSYFNSILFLRRDGGHCAHQRGRA